MRLNDLLPVALMLVVAIIAISVGATITQDINDDFVTGAAGCNSTHTTACGYAFNASDAGLEGIGTLGSWFPTIALVLAASLVIGILVTSFGRQ